ncbi:hypothetical protein BaRGS_00005851 [Batillaria attramentaria]|uniref:Uncharacterized protein n=1 Tax=Batillaria attramentaria TaxID=370345 RepID=A0ABD0LVC6_9CAEN
MNQKKTDKNNINKPHVQISKVTNKLKTTAPAHQPKLRIVHPNTANATDGKRQSATVISFIVVDPCLPVRTPRLQQLALEAGAGGML